MRHGWIFVRVSPNILRHTTRQTDENEREDKEKTENRLDTIKETAAEEMPVSEVVPAPKEGPENRENDNESEINHGGNTEIDDQRGTNSDTEMRTYRGADTEAVWQTEKTSNVKTNDTIRYKVYGQWVTGTILSRAGKASEKYKSWYNVRNENNEERSDDLNRLEWEKIPETEINISQTVADNKNSASNSVENAKDKELEKLAQFQTYEEVANKGQKTLSTRWVITDKGGQTKTRLVVRGFEEKDLERMIRFCHISYLLVY